ncbi:penicillin-binding protein 2 [Desulfovibrionales bacterium]
MTYLSESEVQVAPRSGLVLLQVLIMSMFCIFSLRLWYLQVIKGASLAEQARVNQHREELIYAPRGQLRDRNAVLLAVNRPSYALTLVREDCRDQEGTLAQVSQWTGIEHEVLRKRFDQGRRRVKPFERLVLVPDVTTEIVAQVEANVMFWPGLEIMVRPRRIYPQGRTMAHVLGYVAEASEEELEKDPLLGLGDLVGKQGLEYVLERRLRGTKGLNEIEVDVLGRHLNKEMARTPTGGEDVTLSLDVKLQEHAAKFIEDQAGSIVVLDPYVGQVLALVTRPTYDNNSFTVGLSQRQWGALLEHPRHPLQNRVIQSTYPPGSVWKLLVAACGLHENAIIPGSTFFCPGEYQLGKLTFRCWHKGGHGMLNLREALVHSCDVYFYQLAERLGVDRIARYAQIAGFGSPTGIDLPHEKGGLVPSREWKHKRFGDGWHGGETLNLGIGQGYILVQPLQVARFVAALMNGGHVFKPNLIAGALPFNQGELALTRVQRDVILDAMVQTVERGTAQIIKRSDARLGAKTGTAQVVKIGQERQNTEDVPYTFRDHAWLATWGQKDGQNYVVVCMVEHGGHGGTMAGPVVRGVYDYLFGPSKTDKPGKQG